MAKIHTDPSGVLYAHPHGPRIWDTFNEYTTQQTNGVIKEAPPKGSALFITDIFIQVNAAVNVTIFAGTGRTLFKFIGSAQADGVSRSYKVPKRLRDGERITVSTSGAVTVEVEVHGYTAP